jgi:hypothetical protein
VTGTKKALVCQGFRCVQTVQNNNCRDINVTLTGFEQEPDSSGKPRNCIEDSAESSAVSSDSCPNDPDLARIGGAWPTLARPIRRAILALVENAGPHRP